MTTRWQDFSIPQLWLLEYQSLSESPVSGLSMRVSCGRTHMQAFVSHYFLRINPPTPDAQDKSQPLQTFVVQLHLTLCNPELTMARWAASLSFTISWSLLKLMSIELVMPSNHHPLSSLVLLPPISHSIRVFLMSRLLASGGQGIGAPASVLPMNISVNIVD